MRRLVIFNTSKRSDFCITYRRVLIQISHHYLFYMADLCFWQSCWWHAVRLPLFLTLFCNIQDKSYRHPVTISTRSRASRRVATESEGYGADCHPDKNNGWLVSNISGRSGSENEQGGASYLRGTSRGQAQERRRLANGERSLGGHIL